MAKDVDLSSKEWTDLVFEGKNKEYGAYEMRRQSVGRHNKAMLVLILVIALIGAVVVLNNTVFKKSDKDLALENEQAMAEFVNEEPVEEEPEEQRVEEPEIPEALPEEILNTVKSTELIIAKDEDVKEEIKSQDELKETETAIGNTDFDKGTDDLNVVRTHKEEVIVEEKKPEPVHHDDNKVWTAVEQNPQFPGGDAALYKYLNDHIKYPPIAMENGIQGRVVVQFVVTKNGTIGEVKIARGKDPDLDKEAMRVVRTLPKFNPGKMNGHPVNVWYTLPVQFKLAGQ